MEGRSFGRTHAGGAVARDLSAEDKGRLLLWLKGGAMEMAAELRDAGWEEDERGLWRRDGKGRGWNLLDAHATLRRPRR